MKTIHTEGAFPPLEREQVRRWFAIPGAETYRINKVCPLDDALRTHVKPGMALHFAYSEGRPMAISNALVRCFAGSDPEFTVIAAGLVSNQAAFVSEKLVKRLVVSFVGENYPTPAPNRIFQDAINSGAVKIENQSLLVLYQRLAAGAFGFPFAPTRSWRGSSMERNPGFALVPDPFGSNEEVGVVQALVPDITFVHGLAADPLGNVLLSPPFGEGEIAAFAARLGVVATVERVVSPEVVRRHAHLMKIPAHRVLSVSEAPLGCHPYGVYSPGRLEITGYVEDYDFFMTLRKAAQSATAFSRWTSDWILGVDSHSGYLEKLGAARINELRGRAADGAWEDDLDAAVLKRIAGTEGCDGTELMVVVAARVIERKVREDGFTIIEAGVGYANLAAWLAVTRLQLEQGIPAELVAEIGLYGYLPKPGEPFIFSNRNLSSCKSLTGVESILGLYVSGRHNNCVGIIGAGQIDPSGNINSTYAANGKFLVGSGGANDITSAARDIVAVTHQSKHRLVKELPYVTSPGHHVSTLVTDLGVYEKRNSRLVLVQYFPSNGHGAHEVIEHIRACCGWELEVSDDIRECAPPTKEELVRLRLYDIRNDFLGVTAR